MKKILPFFSYLFHPLFIPLLTVWAFFLIDENYLAPVEKFLVALQVLILMVLLPIAFFFLLRTIGRIDTVMASNVNQRKWPLMAHAVLIFLLTRQSITEERLPELYFYFIAALATTIIALVCAFLKFKLSLHMAAMVSALVFLIGVGIHNQMNLIPFTAFMLLMNGLVASSRLEMNAHSYPELIAGFGAGLIPQLGFWYFWL